MRWAIIEQVRPATAKVSPFIHIGLAIGIAVKLIICKRLIFFYDNIIKLDPVQLCRSLIGSPILEM